QGRIAKYPELAAGGKLAAVIVEPMEALDHIDCLPRLAGPEQCRGKAHGMERHIVLAQKLDVTDVVREPPVLPTPNVGALRSPFLGDRDIGDRRVEPDVEDLSLEAFARHRHAPIEVAGDAAVPQVRREPALRQRGYEW